MGVGNILLLAPSPETGAAVMDQINKENPAISFVDVRIGAWPADGAFAHLGRTDCGTQFVCSKCRTSHCPGCREELVIDVVNDKVLCRECMSVDLLEYLATGAWYGRYASVDEAKAKQAAMYELTDIELERRRLVNGYYDDKGGAPFTMEGLEARLRALAFPEATIQLALHPERDEEART